MFDSLKCQCYWNLSSEIGGHSSGFCHFKWLCYQDAENKPSSALDGLSRDWIRHILYGVTYLSISKIFHCEPLCVLCVLGVWHCCSSQIQVSSWGFVVFLPWSQSLLLSFNWWSLWLPLPFFSYFLCTPKTEQGRKKLIYKFLNRLWNHIQS